ncbi:hypothetical protein AHAS_Ahas05G0043300 [Arachis hypogaea]
MPKIGRYTKKFRLDTACHQPQVGSTAALTSHQADYPIPPFNGSGDPASSTLRAIWPPRSEPPPAQQACTNEVQNSEPTSSSLRAFRPPRSEPPPAQQACTNEVQNSELNAEELDPEADRVDSFDQHIDNLFAASEAQKRKGRKTSEFWNVKTIGIQEFI